MTYLQVQYGTIITFLMKRNGLECVCDVIDNNLIVIVWSKIQYKTIQFLGDLRLKLLIRKYISAQNMKLPVQFKKKLKYLGVSFLLYLTRKRQNIFL